MTVTYLGDARYEGVSGDTKPTTAPTNAEFFETNTGKTFIYNGASWILGPSAVYDTNTVTLTNKSIDSVTNTVSNIGIYKYTIFRSGSNTVCRNNLTGLIESSSTTPETVFQYALDNSLRAGIFVQNGSYTFSAGFTGLTFSQNETWLVCDPGALITVPAGFTGKLYTFAENTSGCHVVGGRYSENPTISRLWTFAYIAAAEGFQTLVTIRDVYVRFARKVIELKVTGTNGWINGNRFEDIYADEFVQGIVFNQVSTQTALNGVNRNDFINITLQSDPAIPTTDGIINVSGISNYFNDCKVWDMPVGQNGVTVSSNATDTIFIGGIIKAANGFVDSGVRTKIIENSNIILPSATLVSPTITTPTFTAALTKAQQHTATVYNDQANSFGVANQNFRSGTLGLTNPAGTFLYQFAGSAITGNVVITLPLLASSDIMATLAFAQTFTNKNINATNNTITDTSTATGDILKSDGTKFTRLARGTNGYILTASGSDISWAINAAATGPVTGRKMGKFDGNNSSLIGTGLFGTFTAIGTHTGVQTSTANGNGDRFTTGAVAGNAAGMKYAVAYTTRAWNCYLGVRFKLGTATNNRVFIGWMTGNTDPSAGSEDPLLNLNGVMLVQRSTDTTFQISTNAATATSTFTNTGVTVDNTSVFTIEFRADATNNKFQWSLNGSAYADLTTNIPAATAYLNYTSHIQTAETAAHTIDIFAVETWSDK